VGPAARAARWLADYGASVVNVAPVDADKQITPPPHAYSGHRGQQRIRLDLRQSEGAATLARLAESADVLIESFRPGVVDRLGVGPAVLRARNPRLVYCSTTGYGQTGPYAQRAGHDLNYLAVAGFLQCSGRTTGGGPAIPGATVADSAGGGMHAVMSILAALVRRASTGEGCYLDVSVTDGVLALMALQIDDHLATGATVGPRQSLLTGRYACYDVYRTADDRWLTVAAIEPRFWANLCQALGLERWTPHQLDDAAQPAIRADLAARFATRSRDAWIAELADQDTCVAPVLGVDELARDPQLSARHAFAVARGPGGTEVRQLAPLLAGAGRPSSEYQLSDPERTDTDQVLAAAGLSPAERDRLKALGAVA
jgi:alpha-methylacyl-CoA racemase